MTLDLKDYIAAGYFLSRYTGDHDCTGIELRRITLATDHSQRRFFPESWTLSWCHESHEERVAAASAFGIAELDLPVVHDWADQSFEKDFGAWNVFFTLDAARAAARRFFGKAPDSQLWGVGLQHDLVEAFCEATKPPLPTPGFAPCGADGLHVATCRQPASLIEGGTILGHEILITDSGCCLNSPESRHLDEQDLFHSMGVAPNQYGLIDSYEQAMACCRQLDAQAGETPHCITGWRPWLIAEYPI